KPGDTLTSIARDYGTTIAEILKINKIPNPDKIYPGQQMNLPVSGEVEPQKTAPTPETEQIIAGKGPENYFDNIAAKLGLTPDELAALNPQIKNRDEIIAGVTNINVPKGKAG